MTVELPAEGSRVSLRYRLPAGSDKPLTDVVGYLDHGAPDIVVRTKSGELIEVAAADVVSVRELSHIPVRNSEIRALEYAAAMAWPGIEHEWRHGWFLRAGRGATSRANSAIPLEVSAQLAALADIADWYRGRDLPAWLALPERLLPVRTEGVHDSRVLVRDIDTEPAPAPMSVLMSDTPDAAWLEGYHRDVPVDVLTAVVDGELTFATLDSGAVGRGAVTTAPDGTRWLGISSVRVAPDQRRRGHARSLGTALLGWGAERGATRAYVQVLADNTPAVRLYTALGFRLHHNHRYVDARSLVSLNI